MLAGAAGAGLRISRAVFFAMIGSLYLHPRATARAESVAVGCVAYTHLADSNL